MFIKLNNEKSIKLRFIKFLKKGNAALAQFDAIFDLSLDYFRRTAMFWYDCQKT